MPSAAASVAIIICASSRKCSTRAVRMSAVFDAVMRLGLFARQLSYIRLLSGSEFVPLKSIILSLYPFAERSSHKYFCVRRDSVNTTAFSVAPKLFAILNPSFRAINKAFPLEFSRMASACERYVFKSAISDSIALRSCAVRGAGTLSASESSSSLSPSASSSLSLSKDSGRVSKFWYSLAVSKSSSIFMLPYRAESAFSMSSRRVIKLSRVPAIA